MYVNARAIIERPGRAGLEILLQTRDKSGQRPQLELPGGQVEPLESLIDALRREVREETGLDLLEIEGDDLRLIAAGEQARVECVRPFAAYQTLAGPVASMGLYFRCSAVGQLQPRGDNAKNPQWLDIAEVRTRLSADQEQFSWVDRAGLLFYLQTRP